MAAFLDNCAIWFENNKLNIVAIFQFLQTSGLLALIVFFVKDFIKVKLDKKKTDENEANIIEIQKSTTELKDEQDVIIYKLNALAEAFTLVYGNLKNEETRMLVQNKLATAKNYTSEQKAKIVEQLETLQKTTEEVLKSSAEKVAEVLNSAKQTTEVITNIER